jgi:tripartite-type tricarboxylate transporter receptor subunit TctC
MRAGRWLVGLLGAAWLAGAAQAQTAWPSRPIRLIVPFPAGGALDTVGRVAAQALGERLDTQIVVENRGGASGAIGVSEAVRAAPDGYTLVFASSDTLTILPLLRRKLPFDPVRDLTPVAKVADSHLLIAVHPSVPAHNIRELVELSRARPGTLRYATPGNGTVHHLAFENFKLLTGADISMVPFSGGGPATAAVMGGHVEVLITGFNVFKSVLGGQLRALAVARPGARTSLMPSVPTMAESGLPEYRASSWFGVFGPAGLPAEIGNRVGRELVAISATPEFQQKVTAVGGDAGGLPRDEFVRFLAAESRYWQRIVEATGIRLED